jgi:hypothetical protein
MKNGMSMVVLLFVVALLLCLSVVMVVAPGSVGDSCTYGYECQTQLCIGLKCIECTPNQKTACGLYECEPQLTCYDSCSSDDECQGDYVCEEGECVECTQSEKTACGLYECKSDFTCYESCITDDECKTDYFCLGYVCYLRNPVADECTKDRECSDGYRCDKDATPTVCYEECIDDAECRTSVGYSCESEVCVFEDVVADECELNKDCSGGYRCDKDATPKVCYEGCTGDAQCRTSVGYSCESEVCVFEDVVADECELNKDCSGGYRCDKDATPKVCYEECIGDAQCRTGYSCESEVCVFEAEEVYCAIGVAECSDGVDNDNDDLVDYLGGCDTDNDGIAGLNCVNEGITEPSECKEYCISDDRDYIEPDPQCRSPLDTDETSDPQCADGINNDHEKDGIDYPNDPNCDSPEDNTESATGSMGAPSLAPEGKQNIFVRFVDWLTFWN